ncbi:peptide chain release factor N(5)-glutamine methyltransferase [Thermodesulfobacteriota bacterium]
MQIRKTNPKGPWTILKLLNWAVSYFSSLHVENPRASAEILLAHTLKSERIDLYVRYDQPLTNDELARFKSFIQRRAKREPVAYIVGEKEFWSLPFFVSKDVLIPRPETECLIESALSLLSEAEAADSNRLPRRILDLGTGSGAIVLALASERPDDLFFASDYSVNAVQTARKNAARSGFDKRIGFFSGDWLAPVQGRGSRLDMIVSNPPYIPSEDIAGLQPEVCDYEPSSALDGGIDGLFCLKRIIGAAPDVLNPNGYLLLEIGHDQKKRIRSLIDRSGRYTDVSFVKDYSGLDRVVCMKRR